MTEPTGVLSTARPEMPECEHDHCITCGDVAEPMRVVRIDAERGLALCSDAKGARHTVEIALVQPVAVDR